MPSRAIRIGEYDFDDASYDAAGDVLYLRTAGHGPVARTFGTPEGHAVRLDRDGHVVGMTVVNARWLLERDGEIAVTVPAVARATRADLAAVLDEPA